jgi:hypothetical protein
MLMLAVAMMLAAAPGTDAWFAQRERDKWENWNEGRTPIDLSPWFAPGAVNIGYFEKGPARTGIDSASIAAIDRIMRTIAPKPGAITLSDFKIVRVGGKGAIVTYLIDDKVGPLGHGFVTSVWEKRGDRWLTVFYQATAGPR